jgi:hypothetical protein
MKDKMKERLSKGGNKSEEPAAGTPIFLRVSTIENFASVSVCRYACTHCSLSFIFPYSQRTLTNQKTYDMINTCDDSIASW